MKEMEDKLRAEIKTEFEASQKAVQEDKPNFVEVDTEKVNAYINTTEDKIQELRQEGNILEAKRLEKALNATLADLDANEERKQAFIKRQEEKKTGQEATTAATNARLEKLDKAAEFFRDRMKIEKPVWDKMGEWFAKACTSDPILGAEFTEKVNQGEIGAIKWAHEYTVKNMGLKTQKANEKKEQSKTQIAALSTAQTGSGGKIDIKEIKAAFDADPSPENFARYQEAKRRSAA